jgi:hypothetical protein
MAWSEFTQRFIPDFYKTYGRLPTDAEIAEAEVSFRNYLRSQGFIPEDEQPTLPLQQLQKGNEESPEPSS